MWHVGFEGKASELVITGDVKAASYSDALLVHHLRFMLPAHPQQYECRFDCDVAD